MKKFRTSQLKKVMTETFTEYHGKRGGVYIINKLGEVLSLGQFDKQGQPKKVGYVEDTWNL